MQTLSTIPFTNMAKSCNGASLSSINSKQMFYRHMGLEVVETSQVVFVHSLGGTNEYWGPLISSLGLADSHSLHLYDLEGHGLSPTSPISTLTIASFVGDLKGVFEGANISSGATLIAHFMGCLIALNFVIANPGLVSRLILMGPPSNPFPSSMSTDLYAFADVARTYGLEAVADAFETDGVSSATKQYNPVAAAAVRMSVLGQDPESYAKACSAFAGATQKLDLGMVDAEVLIVAGREDRIAPPAASQRLAKMLPNCRELVILEGVGNWHVFEDCRGVSAAVKRFML